MRVTMQDGSTYTGWRAIPLLLLFSPLIVFWFLYAVFLAAFLFVVRWVTGHDELFGWRYDGHGTWSR